MRTPGRISAKRHAMMTKFFAPFLSEPTPPTFDCPVSVLPIDPSKSDHDTDTPKVAEVKNSSCRPQLCAREGAMKLAGERTVKMDVQTIPGTNGCLQITEIIDRAALVGVTIRLAGGSVDFINLHRANEHLKRSLESARAALTEHLTAEKNTHAPASAQPSQERNRRPGLAARSRPAD